MQPQTAANERVQVEATLGQLEELQRRPDAVADHETARAWHQALSESHTFLSDTGHPVVFIGEVGVGKSSLVAVVARLLLGEQVPRDRHALRSQSLLAIGAGRTTVCEVRVRAAQLGIDKGALGIEIEPLSPQEMQQVVDIWAEDEWRRRRSHARMPDDSLPTPQEIGRALRAMAGYGEYVESYKDDANVLRRRTVQPLDAAVALFESEQDFAAHLYERIGLASRSQTHWWWESVTAESLKELKTKAEAINLGSDPTAALPQRMTLVVPDPLPGVAVGDAISLSLIDTRGLEAGVGLFGRADLQEFASDPRATLVLCAPFKAAPGEAARNFLVSLNGDARWRDALSRTVLVLLDHGDADQVNGADGERLSGQDIKIAECRAALLDAGLRDLDVGQVVALDVLSDPRERLVDVLTERIGGMRAKAEEELAERLHDARAFLDRRGQAARKELQAKVDDGIKQVLSENMPVGPPMRDPLAGLREAIQLTRYASVIYATCRRKGTYRGLNLYQSVKAEASRAMTAWLSPVVDAVLSHLDVLGAKQEYAGVRDFVHLRHRQFSTAKIDAVIHYASAVEAEVRAGLLSNDSLWRSCCDEWGQGTGFKQQVLFYFGDWAKRQILVAHEDFQSVATNIPFWPDVARPMRAPQFSLRVQQLRALREVTWTPAPVSLLIGANGAGKTTMLLVLRLLRLAYERGLSDAVRLALGGSNNLHSWGAAHEPIQIGLDVGSSKWKITLNPQEGSVDPFGEESLTDGDVTIYRRDAFGVLRYQDQVIKTEDALIGLRTLVDRGAIDPAIRTIAAFLQKVFVFQDPDLNGLRKQGSDSSDDQSIRTRSENVLAVLRRWHQDRSQRHRYDFVVGGLNAAFPNAFADIDFQQVGNTLNARVYRSNQENPTWLVDEATGVLQMLVILSNVASTDDGGVVAIDEPENGLHPYAQTAFLRYTQQWAARHHVTVLLATHSLVLLDEFTSKPEAVYVMNASGDADVEMPAALDQLCNRDWLAKFKLGELYEQGEFGSNGEAS